MISFKRIRSAIYFILILLGCILISHGSRADIMNGFMSKPNTERALERLLGLTVVLPYPYYQKPKYRYPVYDRSGRGTLLYGYGGPDVYEYKEFTPIEGHH